MTQTNKASDIARAISVATNCLETGRLPEAEMLCRKILTEEPQNADALHLLGAVADETGNHTAAIELIRQAISIRKKEPLYHARLGQALQNALQYDEAIAEYERALTLKPDMLAVHMNIGNMLMEQGKFDVAEKWYERAGILDPTLALVPYNLGGLFQAQQKADKAIAAYTQALKLDPQQSEARNNLGLIYKDTGQFSAAMECFARALKLKPGDKRAQANIGITLLMQGKLAEGWPGYESRWEGLQPSFVRPATTLPQWAGEMSAQLPAKDDRLLLFCEQGWGDKLQFSRYIPMAMEKFPAGVSVITDRPLQSLFRRSFPGVDILEEAPGDQSGWQWHCPLMSLPLAFGTTLETIPAQTPYLVPDAQKIAYWKDKIAALKSSARKIGVVWKPGKIMKSAKQKALSFQQLKPLLEQPGISWFSLQKDPDPEIEPGRLIDWSAEFNDFDDTAALMMNMDLIISVDTSTAHLAGALNVPVWMLNRYASDWRWLRGRDDSPWYPSMRIFTQKVAGNWDEVVRRLVVELKNE
jgi:tetratricopeptide (TPR) repeat protein